MPLGLILPAFGVASYHTSVFIGLDKSFRVSPTNGMSPVARKKVREQHFLRKMAWLIIIINLYSFAIMTIGYYPRLVQARLNGQLISPSARLNDQLISPSTKLFTTARMRELRPLSNPPLPGYCNWGIDGNSEFAVCDGTEQGGSLCNDSQEGCKKCGGKWCTNACDPFKCPPRNDISPEEQYQRHRQLCQVQATLKKRGYKGNPRELNSFVQRGYATYESSAWRKPEKCRSLLNDDLIRINHWETYKADYTQHYIKKLFNDEFNLVFLLNHKVGSTSFPSYLDCEYGSWKMVGRAESNNNRYVITAVRDPVARFVSATGEVLQRAVNQFCIDRSCDENHGFFGNKTINRLKHQTSWYSLLQEPSWASEDLLPNLIRAMVNDLKCNYNAYSLDHYISQSAFVSQNLGEADPIDFLIKLENSNNGLTALSTLTNHSQSDRCSLKETNTAVTKPKGVPSSKEIQKVINENDDIMRDLCFVYIQVSLKWTSLTRILQQI